MSFVLNCPHSMEFLVAIVVLILFHFSNSLFYSIALLVIVLGLLFSLVSNILMSSFLMLLICIVYVGAIIILIGYICSISPNLVTPSHFNLKQSALLLSLLLSFLSFSPTLFSANSSSSLTLLSYFYSSFGVSTFSSLVVILFVTLLIVTSQHLTPNGPFRSTQA